MTALIAVGVALSNDRRAINLRTVASAFLLLVGVAALVLYLPQGKAALHTAGAAVQWVINYSYVGISFLFGDLATDKFGFVFALRILPIIIFFSALMAVLYHIGIMQWVVRIIGGVFQRVIGTRKVESFCAAANIFVSQAEAPLVVRPYISKMTISELNALMTGGFATIAGSVLAVYVGFLGPEFGPHRLTASVMSAPAAFLVAKIMQPEVETSETAGKLEFKVERTAGNLIEAAANGTSDGLKLWLNVIAMLIAFTALISFINWPLGWIGETPFATEGLSLSFLFGKVFAPVAWFMGVEGWHDCELFGSLLGIKISLNELVAFSHMKTMLPGSGGAVVFEHARSGQMAAYALCGFANFASIGIQMGGITPLAPDRKKDLSRIALRAMLGGAFASWMTATIAGMFLA